LIATRGLDNQEVLAKISKLKNEMKHELNDSWGVKLSELFA